MDKNEKRKYCSCCEDNFYNGNNNLGVKECWNFKTAKLVSRKQVPMKQRTGKECKKINCKNYKYYSNWGRSLVLGNSAIQECIQECVNCKHSYISQYKKEAIRVKHNRSYDYDGRYVVDALHAGSSKGGYGSGMGCLP